MPSALTSQLDYIYFFYGLALFLVGLLAFSMSSPGRLATPWKLLALFAVLHGAAEWLQLLALTRGESPWLALAFTLLIAAAFLVLLEFARRTHRVLFGRTVGPWLHLLPVVAVAGLTLASGPAHLISAARLLIAAPAVLWSASLFLAASTRTEARGEGGATRRARRFSAVTFAAFGLAAGLVVPRAPFLPAAWPTAEAFLGWTSLQIQLVRAFLVCGMALSIWALAVSSDPKSEVLRKRRLLFWVMTSSVAALLIAGWLFTDWLGRLYERDAFEEASASASQVYDHLVDQMQAADGGARAMAELLNRQHLTGSRPDRARLDQIVDAFALASEGWVAFILDEEGTAITTSNRGRPDSFLGVNYAMRPYFHAAIDGRPGRFIGMGVMSRVPGYFASEPVRGAGGQVILVAVVKRNLDKAQLGPKVVGDSIIVSGQGRALVTSRKELENQRIWSPRAKPARQGPPPGDGGDEPPVYLDHEVEGTEWVAAGGLRQVAVRRPIPGSEWSLLLLKREATQVPNRILGIIITLLLCAVVLGYFVAMQRQLATESHLSDKRREAEGLARDFARQADTDALTGVLNRLGFEAAFSRELERSRRYGHPLSVVMLDLDHFKRVNDVHGHAAGDQVLVGVARSIETNLRSSDTIGRWGGEEFVVLAPSTGAEGAVRLAEKLRSLMATTPLGPAGAATGSFGVAELRPGDTAESLLHRADEALYRAKSQGRNRVESDDVNVAAVLAASAAEPAGAAPMLDGASMYAATGFGPIDLEHRALGDAIASFFDMLSTAKNEEVQVAFESILVGVGAHFEHEERLMASYRHPDRASHVQKHAVFLEEAQGVLQELEAKGVTVPFRRWVVGRLPEWFRLHIIEHDVKLGRFLVKTGAVSELAPPEAV